MNYDHVSMDQERFSLHDCRATTAEWKDGQLIFRLPDGFYCVDYGDDWPNTGKAEVEFRVDAMRGASYYQFIETGGQTIRREGTIEELVDRINRGEWELEFAYRYDGYQEVLYRCWIWEDSEPWTYECVLSIGTKENTIYRWDSPEGLEE